MQNIIHIIRNATNALPNADEVKASGEKYSARDWAGFFAAVAAFMAKLLPLLIPLFVATTDESK